MDVYIRRIKKQVGSSNMHKAAIHIDKVEEGEGLYLGWKKIVVPKKRNEGGAGENDGVDNVDADDMMGYGEEGEGDEGEEI